MHGWRLHWGTIVAKRIRVERIGGAVTRDDGLLSLGVSVKGKTTTIEFAPETLEFLTTAVLASSRDPLGPSSTRFRPAGLSRFEIDDEIGISFLLGQDIAIHVLLDREGASALRGLLDTFDNPKTWDGSKPH